MNTEHIKELIIIAQEGSINKAAKKLCVNPSNLITHINLFEDEIRGKVFERSREGIKLTVKGQMVLDKAKQMLEISEGLVKMVSDENEIILGSDMNVVHSDMLSFLEYQKNRRYTIKAKANSIYDSLEDALRFNNIDVYYDFKNDDLYDDIKYTDARIEDCYAVSKRGLFSKDILDVTDLNGKTIIMGKRQTLKNKQKINVLNNTHISYNIKETDSIAETMIEIGKDNAVLLEYDSYIYLYESLFDVKPVKGIEMPCGLYYKKDVFPVTDCRRDYKEYVKNVIKK